MERIAHSLIFGEWPERIAHGCSFVMRDLSDSLTVVLLIWVTWVICSQPLIFLSDLSKLLTVAYLIWAKWDIERMSDWANEGWAIDQIPSPERKLQYKERVTERYRTGENTRTIERKKVTPRSPEIHITKQIRKKERKIVTIEKNDPVKDRHTVHI